MLDKLKFIDEQRDKTAFYASDTGKPLLDLYFSFKGVEKSNPPNWWDTLKWSAGTGVEDAIVKIFKSNGVVPEDYDQKVHGYIDIQREGVDIHGYIDAKMIDGTPIEIKSINNANKWDIKRYESNQPRENYVGQLAVYMDALGVDIGHLFVASIDGLNRFWFDCNKIGERTYKCGETVVELDKIYKRWADLYNNHVLKDTPPDIWEYRYKVPVEEIDFKSLSTTDIGKMRNGAKVHGDFQISYSPYKELIIGLQGETLGYTPKEIEFIKEKTKGFSSKVNKW